MFCHRKDIQRIFSCNYYWVSRILKKPTLKAMHTSMNFWKHVNKEGLYIFKVLRSHKNKVDTATLHLTLDAIYQQIFKQHNTHTNNNLRHVQCKTWQNCVLMFLKLTHFKNLYSCIIPHFKSGLQELWFLRMYSP